VISHDRLVGAILVGDVSEAGPITTLIRRGLRLSELKRFDPSRPIHYAQLAVQWGSGVGEAGSARVRWDRAGPDSATG